MQFYWRSRNGGILGCLIFGTLFAVAGYFLAFSFGKPILDNAKQSSAWPSVPGAIVASEVKQERGHNGSKLYSAQVRYRYQVAGEQLEGDTVWFGGGYSSSSQNDARSTVQRYPAGKQVSVYYDPRDAANSVLEPGATFSSYLLFGMGLLFLTVGLLLAGGTLLRMLFGGLLL